MFHNSNACSVILVSINVALTYLNYRGLHIVGYSAVAMAVFTLLPFIVLTLFGELCVGVCGEDGLLRGC